MVVVGCCLCHKIRATECCVTLLVSNTRYRLYWSVLRRSWGERTQRRWLGAGGEKCARGPSAATRHWTRRILYLATLATFPPWEPGPLGCELRWDWEWILLWNVQRKGNRCGQGAGRYIRNLLRCLYLIANYETHYTIISNILMTEHTSLRSDSFTRHTSCPSGLSHGHGITTAFFYRL